MHIYKFLFCAQKSVAPATIGQKNTKQLTLFHMNNSNNLGIIARITPSGPAAVLTITIISHFDFGAKSCEDLKYINTAH